MKILEAIKSLINIKTKQVNKKAPTFTYVTLYSLNLRPNKCYLTMDDLDKGYPIRDLRDYLQIFGDEGFELKSVIKNKQHTHYILQRTNLK